MKITSVKKHIINCYNKNITCMLWGPPGCGKSSIVKQSAQELGIDLIDVRLPQLEPADLRGIPVPNRDSKKIEWYCPEFLPETGKGILFFDEIEKSPVSVKNASLELILDKRLGKYQLPKNWSVVAAGNNIDDDCFSQSLGSALSNRMIHFDIQPDLDAWIEWGRQNKIRDEIFGYLSFRPEHLFKYEQGSNAFPSPRSWEMLNTMLNGVSDKNEIKELFEATIGKSVGNEYRAWLSFYQYIDVMGIIREGKLPDYSKIEAGKEKSFVFALTSRIANYIKDLKDTKELDMLGANLAKFLNSLEPEMRVCWCKQVPSFKIMKLMENKDFFIVADKIVRTMYKL